MTSDIERIPWDVDHADGYLLCFDIPLGDDSRPGAMRQSLRRHCSCRAGEPPAQAQAGQGRKAHRPRPPGGHRLDAHADLGGHRPHRGTAAEGQRGDALVPAVLHRARDGRPGPGLWAGDRRGQGAVPGHGRQPGGPPGSRPQAKAQEPGRGTGRSSRRTSSCRHARHSAAAAWIAAHPAAGAAAWQRWRASLDGTPVVTPPMRARQAVLSAQAAAVVTPLITADPGSIADPDDPWAPEREVAVAGGPWSEAEAG